MSQDDRSAIGCGRMRKTDDPSSLPHEPGIYRHVNKETGEIDYVGQTNDLNRRQHEHARDGRYDPATQDILYATTRPGADKEALRRTEQDHISRHNPKGNKTRGGNGR